VSRVSGFQARHSPSVRGFTLVELMIVVVIVAILLAVALPSYQNSVQKGRRADAKSALLDAANRQEGNMLDRGTYSLELTDLGFNQNPYLSEEGHYSVAATVCSGTAFILHSNGSKTATGSDELNCW
jgi:type IV pilus assembly protein PilE